MSDIKNNIKESGNISRQALSWLRDKQLPADPVCYHVAYKYFQTTDPEMRRRVEQIQGTPSEIIESVEQIYHDFVVARHENNIKQFSKKVDDLANETVESVNHAQSNLESYGETLKEAKPYLESAWSEENLAVIEVLIAETDNVYQESKYLGDKLASASKEIQALQAQYLEFKQRANLDALTQVLNRSGLNEAFAALSEDDANYPVSLLLADIDHFKKFNDEYGHLIGDKVLKLVAATLRKNLKRRDILARFGGEEFLLLLPQTELANAAKLAESLRRKIEGLAVKKRNSDEYLRKVTLSIGACELQNGKPLNNGIECADRALYKSKNQGRNCVNTAKKEESK